MTDSVEFDDTLLQEITGEETPVGATSAPEVPVIDEKSVSWLMESLLSFRDQRFVGLKKPSYEELAVAKTLAEDHNANEQDKCEYAVALYASGKVDEACATCAEICALQSVDPETIVDCAYFYAHVGSYNAAMYKVRTVVAKGYKTTSARFLLAKLYLGNGSADLAELWFKHILGTEEHPSNEVRWLLAISLMKQSKYTEALRHLRISAQSTDGAIYNLRACCHNALAASSLCDEEVTAVMEHLDRAKLYLELADQCNCYVQEICDDYEKVLAHFQRMV